MIGPTMRLATCSCGKLTATCDGEPVRVSVCHCLACQKRTGSAFGAQARFPEDRVTIEGTSTEYTRTGDSGGLARFRFCPTCGTTLCWTVATLPGFVAVALGAFADPTFRAPTVSIYEARRHRWCPVEGQDVEHYD
jgi:hypothetical protein